MTKQRTPSIRKHGKIPDTVKNCARSYALAQSRLNVTLTRHLVDDFDAHGAEVIATLRQEKPVDYVRLVNAILQEDSGEATLEPTYNVVERRIVRPGDPDI